MPKSRPAIVPDDDHQDHSRITIHDPIPAVMTIQDLARVLHLSASRAYALEKTGAFAWCELALPGVVRPKRYSGQLFSQWLGGERTAPSPDMAKQFDRLRRRLHMAKARKP